MAISVFDLFKIGIGPSSSHTVGPMRAAQVFSNGLKASGLLGQVGSVKAELYGSLGATGKGHGSDKAVILGLLGHEPDSVPIDQIPALLASVKQAQALVLMDGSRLPFAEADDLIFHRRETLPFH